MTTTDKTFNADYQRFITTASITPDGLFWSIWDRLNNVPVSRINDHNTVHPITESLNASWSINHAPPFITWEPVYGVAIGDGKFIRTADVFAGGDK